LQALLDPSGGLFPLNLDFLLAHQGYRRVQQRHPRGLIGPHIGPEAQTRLFVPQIDWFRVGAGTLGNNGVCL
jgi:hypothetical protein